MTKEALKHVTRDDTEHGKDYYLASDVDALLAQPVQPVQQPVAWAVVGDGKFGLYQIGRETETDLSVCKYWSNRGYDLVPLYTTPPQREWVGLTDEEIKAFDTWLDNREEEVGWVNPSEIVDYIEAKCKDKNT